MTELYLNGVRIELGTDVAVSLTRQINNLGELKDRQATYTNTIKIPKTPFNVSFFDGLGAVVGSESRAPYDLIRATFIVESIALLEDGKAIIKETADEYQCAIYDDGIHIVDAIGSKALNELTDLATLNHSLTTTNFIDSFTHTSADGYIYAISDFGNLSLSSIVINNQLPSFFAKWIFDKIFEDAGYTHDLNLDSSLLITPKRGYDSNVDTGGETDVTLRFSPLVFFYTTPFLGFLEFFVTHQQNLTFTPVVNGGINVSETSIKILINGNYNFQTTTLFITEQIKIYNNGIFVNAISNIRTNVLLNLQIGDTITLVYERSLLAGNTTYTLNFNIRVYTEIGATGFTVNASTFIGEIKQYEFVKDIMQLYGLVSTRVKSTNQIKFKRMADILNDKANAYDWSDKVLIQSESYQLDGYAKSNLFKYKYRQADGEHFADGRLAIRNETLKPEITILTRPYNAPENSETIINSEVLTYTPFWEPERDETGIITKWKVIKGVNYFGKLKNTSTSIVYKTANGTDQNYTGTVPLFNFRDLTYQDFINLNYIEIKKALDSYKELKVDIQMDLFEFEAFDFFRLIYARQLGGYYYVNSLKWMNGKRNVQAELIKVN